MSKVLLCRPSFPDSRNSVFRIPIGLCKLSAYHKDISDEVYYVEGTVLRGDIPYNEIDIVYVTTMFTYWSSYSIEAINFYKKMCPNAKIVAGGVYASISPDHLKANSLVDEVVVGVIPEVEYYYPDYSILQTDNEKINNTQIIWASRGCKRNCDHCYVHVIEPKLFFSSPEDVILSITRNKTRKNVLLYDNSLMQHPELPKILNMFKHLHKEYKFVFNCTQGIDGRMMKEWEEKGVSITKFMKEAGFYDLRFSYDWSFQKDSVYYCIDKFEEAGYKRNEMQIFVIINSNDSPDEVESRYWELYELGVQIHSDRYRPGNAFHDNYDGSKKPQTTEDYFINEEKGWTDTNIKGMLRFMSALNYANRMKCLFVEVEDMQKSKILNKGKSSMKLKEFLT